MMQPAELLQNLGVVGIPIENPSVSCFGGIILHIRCQQEPGTSRFDKHTSLRCS